jgi:hypothetical protein
MQTTIAAALACVTLVPCLFAQDTSPKTHARLGLGTTTMYFFRGLMQQDGGIIDQPYLEISRGGVEVFNTPFAWHVGTWKLETSLDIYILGDTAKRVNNGDSAEVVLGVNLNLSF